jgi:pyruvate,water dikinase
MLRFLRRFLKEEDDAQVVLQKKFASFRNLLESNNRVLALMADMEDKASGDFVFDEGYLTTQVQTLEREMTTIVTEINRLSDGRYPELVDLSREILARLQGVLTSGRVIPDTPVVLPLSALTRDAAPAVGVKMAHLGEAANRLGLAVPEGFAVTASAYRLFLTTGGLNRRIEELLARAAIDDLAGLERISREVQDLVRHSPLPPALVEALAEAARSLSAPWLAVRSSAVGEDTEFSFAGQFLTLLNVKNEPQALAAAYREIVASKFRPRAVFYWKYRHFSLEELPMAVGVLAMVPARVSGILFSTDPRAPEAEVAVISAVWGLGPYAVDGRLTPDIFRVSRAPGHQVVEARVADKSKALTAQEEGGVMEVAVSPDEARAAALTDAQLSDLVELGLTLERHFGGPQDIEWAFNPEGALFILQCRPLRVSGPAFAAAAPEPPPGLAPPLLTFGVRASGGVGAGPVFLLRHDREVTELPPGAVVVARQPSSRLVLIMDRISAIVTEVGNPTDHMSILAREFRVPTLVDVGGATRVLQPGQMVTVDADHGFVYPGVIRELLARRPGPAPPWKDNPVYHKLAAILKEVVPLHLLDPQSPDFIAANCRTVHDITRFCHEKAMDAMFFLDVEQAVEAKGVCRLQTDLPLNIFVLDLGGGLAVEGRRQVSEADITSRPFRALLRGFHHPQVRWAGSVAPDLKGFLSVWANTMYDMGKGERGLGGKSFAIITDRYLNFNSRLGYHFGQVDAYLSEERNDNYITFQFKGGAAAIDRRERRARLLGLILEDLGFKVQIRGDLVQGRLVKYSFLETEEMLEMSGLLMAFCRQLDLALSSDAVLDRCFQAFKQRDYRLTFLQPKEG